MSQDLNGVALVGEILARLADGEAFTAAVLADRLGATRTTAFDVLRRLQAAGFIERDARGVVAPGSAAGMFGFAPFGLAEIAAAAAALLPMLRDDTEAHAELVVREAGRDTVLLRRNSAAWSQDGARGRGELVIEAPIEPERRDVLVRLHLRGPANRSEQEAARRSLRAVADALGRSLRQEPAPGEQDGG